MPDFPDDLHYTSEHEWVRGDTGQTIRVGITEYAAEQLGDVVFVTLPEVGETLAAGDACGELESTKSVSDIFVPVAGTVAAINPVLEGAPETINADPYGDGWLFDLDTDDGADLEGLMDAVAYAEEVSG